MRPSATTVYYRLGGKHPTIQRFPDGLKIIAGAADTARFGWKCTFSTGPGLGDPPPQRRARTTW
jgi:hypothetical protein